MNRMQCVLSAACGLVVIGFAPRLVQASPISVPNGSFESGTGNYGAGQHPDQYYIDFNSNLPNGPNGQVSVGGADDGNNKLTLWAGWNGQDNTSPALYSGVNMNIWTLGNELQNLTVAGDTYVGTVAVGEWSGDGNDVGAPAPTFRVGIVDVDHTDPNNVIHTPLALSDPFTPSSSGTWTDISTPVFTAPASGHGIEIDLYVDGFYGIHTAWDSTQAQIDNFRLEDTSPVPEPASLMTVGAIGMLLVGRRRRREARAASVYVSAT